VISTRSPQNPPDNSTLRRHAARYREPVTRYDTIGRTYTSTRRADPRIERQIHAALGDARSVVNVGAGTGSYEPTDRFVAAVEPSPVMLTQRAPGSAPAVQGVSAALPFPDDTFDAALASLTIHHWPDWRAGLAEVRRVARRVVIFTWDPRMERDFWMVDDYLPELAGATATDGPPLAELADALGGARIEPVPVAADCIDGFFAAYWARPEAYLDPVVRAGISCFTLVDDARVTEQMAALRDDLESGAWDARHRTLRGTPEYDFGYRLVISG
jgi:SAM-dependent methyltransferase